LDTGGGEAAGNGFADAAASAERGFAFEREDGLQLWPDQRGSSIPCVHTG
jgi:hypothetical protein